MSSPSVLVVGSWAKEEITLRHLKEVSSLTTHAFLDTPNPGIQTVVNSHAMGELDDVSTITSFARECGADLVLPTTAAPLAAGLVDNLEEAGISVFGPPRQAARLEFDKAFTRDFLKRYDIGYQPAYACFNDRASAETYAETLNWDVAVKPIGLTDGLGVRVAGDQLRGPDEIRTYIKEVLAGCGDDCPAVIIEERLVGVEFTLQCLVNGSTVIPTPLVQDFKKLLPGDLGPNTASMGSYSGPGHLLPYITQNDYDTALGLIRRTVAEFLKETGVPCRGFLYGQFMLTGNGPVLIEYNFRPGDPEWMDIMTRLEDPLFDTILSLMNGETPSPSFSSSATVCKYLVPPGYPESYDLPLQVDVDLSTLENLGVQVYHSAGLDPETGLLHVGSERGIAVIAEGSTIPEANERVESAIETIEGTFVHRSDIGTTELIMRKRKNAVSARLSGLSVRPARENDVDHFRALSAACPPLENYPYHVYAILLRISPSTSFLLEYSGEPAGFVLGLPFSDESEAYFLWQIGILPDHQGAGFGKIFLTKIEEILAVRGFRRIELTIDPQNVASRRLFESSGYVNVSEAAGRPAVVNQQTAVKDLYGPGRHFMRFGKTI